MKLSISNIAWDPEDDDKIAKLLLEKGIEHIDIAPRKYFSSFSDTTQNEISILRKKWADRGFRLYGMQALLFGTKDLNVFGDQEVKKKMLRHFEEICRIAAHLEIQYLVFGSPKNRDRSHLDDNETHDQARDFFFRLGEVAKRHDTFICLEPNPKCYGANFMIDSKETAEIVKAVSHPQIKMQFDTGAVTVNEEDSEQILNDFRDMIGHIHLSEPELVPLGDSTTDHNLIANALSKHSFKVSTIEMLKPKNEVPIEAISRAVDTANLYYGRI